MYTIIKSENNEIDIIKYVEPKIFPRRAKKRKLQEIKNDDIELASQNNIKNSDIENQLIAKEANSKKLKLDNIQPENVQTMD